MKLNLILDTSGATKSVQKLRQELDKITKPLTVGGGSKGNADPLDAMSKSARKNIDYLNRSLEAAHRRLAVFGESGEKVFQELQQDVAVWGHEMRNLPFGLVKQRMTELNRTRLDPAIENLHALGHAGKRTGRDFGKFSTALFQSQQVIEDFGHAGLRGVTNNLGFMASTLGGPAGVVALLGVLGLTVVPTAAEAMGVFKDRTAENNAELEKMRQHLEWVEEREKSRSQIHEGVGYSDAIGIDAERGRLEALRNRDRELSTFTKREKQLNLFRDAESLAGRIGKSGMTTDKRKLDQLESELEKFRERARGLGVNADELLYRDKSIGERIGGAFTPGYIEEGLLPDGKTFDTEGIQEQIKKQEELVEESRNRSLGFSKDARTQQMILEQTERIVGLNRELNRLLDERKEKYGDTLGPEVDTRVLEIEDALKRERYDEAERRAGKLNQDIEQKFPMGESPDLSSRMPMIPQHQYGAVGTPQTQGGSTSNVVNNSTVNHYSANVSGLPSRPSLTLREISELSARQSKAQAQRSGVA